MRLMTAVIFIFITHLYYGISLEMVNMKDDKSEDAFNPSSSTQDEVLRALRICSILFLICLTLYLFGALLPLCSASGLDGSRLRRPNAYQDF